MTETTTALIRSMKNPPTSGTMTNAFPRDYDNLTIGQH